MKRSVINLSKVQHVNRKNVTSETNLDINNSWNDLCHLLRYHALVRKVYFFAKYGICMMNFGESYEMRLPSPEASI